MLRQSAKVAVNQLRAVNQLVANTSIRCIAGGKPTAHNAIRKTIDGNEATTLSAYRVSDAAIIYPISPSSTMGELAGFTSALLEKRIAMQKAEAAKPEAAKPEAAKAEAAKPEAAKPDAAKPDAAKPEAAKSDETKSAEAPAPVPAS